MSYKVTLSLAQWQAMDKLATENVNRFASWIADDYKNPAKQHWIEDVKERYELWKDIQKSLMDAEVLALISD